MTSVIHLLLNGIDKTAYLTYNFNQVSNAILIAAYNDILKNGMKLFLYYEHGAWVTDKIYTSAYIDALCNNKDLYRLLFNKDGTVRQIKMAQEFLLLEHALLLYNACS